MIHKRWILAEGNRWSMLERAPKCDLCDDLFIREFIQNTFLMEVTKSIHLTGFINLTRGCRPQLELYLCFGSETQEYFAAAALIVHSSPPRCTVITLNSKPSCQSLLRSVFMVCWHLGMASSHWGWAFTSRWVHKSTRWYVLWPYVGIVRRFRDKCKKQRVTRGMIAKERSGRERGSWEHLVGYGVLVGEPLSAWQVFIYCRDDLQYVVMWGQSCKKRNVFQNKIKMFSTQCPKMDVIFSVTQPAAVFFFLFKMQCQHWVSQPLGAPSHYTAPCQQAALEVRVSTCMMLIRTVRCQPVSPSQRIEGSFYILHLRDKQKTWDGRWDLTLWI